ncbi:hypothetical protein [Deinococcus enclensis]|uniref:Uncharacterized protein n=1 Tax=Deinococcus enclensis TaxID=1049582 RepID=A0ABT9MHP2_9DEIO|nr:hypothetical protein [Deinococcus enclensis]MDP9766110.1 hypothetical protein [Deinococcus enclensis]
MSKYPYPQTRDEYRAAILFQIYQLVQAVEADNPGEHHTAQWTARNLHNDVREYFNAERWKPRPVYDGIRALVPLDTPLTLLIVHHQEHANGNQRFVQGRVDAISTVYQPSDGATFSVIPRGCRKPCQYAYWARAGASLTIWPGWVPETRLKEVTPLYEHAGVL